MGARGFWATYAGRSYRAWHGLFLFDDDFNPTLNSDAGLEGVEGFLAPRRTRSKAVSGAGWKRTGRRWRRRAVATSWQEPSGTRSLAPRSEPDRRRLSCRPSIRASRAAGFAPTNVAGSTSRVAATSPIPGAFPMLALLTTASIAGDERGRTRTAWCRGYRSVLGTEPQAVSPPLQSLWPGFRTWARRAPRNPRTLKRDRRSATSINRALVGRISAREASITAMPPRRRSCGEEAAASLRQRAFHHRRLPARGRFGEQALAVLMAGTAPLARSGAAHCRSRRTLKRRS